MTELNHTWEPTVKEGHVSLNTCRSCGVKRRTFPPPAGETAPVVQYLESGVGWTNERPSCFIPGVKQKTLFDSLL
jgi:hypothetical protein